jgi:hypothetical protein
MVEDVAFWPVIAPVQLHRYLMATGEIFSYRSLGSVFQGLGAERLNKTAPGSMCIVRVVQKARSSGIRVVALPMSFSR